MTSAAAELTKAEMTDAVVQLDQALHHHDIWIEDLHCTLICRSTPDRRDIVEDAFRQCRFGQWYYGSGADKFAANPNFKAVETEHRRVHECAAGLLRALVEERPIHIGEYEHLSNALKRMRLEIQTLKHEFEESLYNLDSLTGVASRVGMLTHLRDQRQLVKRNIGPCSIAMLDLDHFKAINDAYGHVTGDHVLVAIAQYAKTNIRPYDRVFRYGGEEFLLCAPNTEIQVAQALCDRLRTGLADIQHMAAGHPPFHVTVSFGLAFLDPDLPVEVSIERADKALYDAKSTGRNRVSVWNETL